MAKLPSFQFYPGDWMKDAALRRCSLFAKGLLMDLLCLMFEQIPRGYLKNLDGSPWSIDDIARATGCTVDEAKTALGELTAKGVLKVDDGKCLYSSRLVRDEEIRKARVKAGSKGGSKTQANRQANSKQITEDEDEGEEVLRGDTQGEIFARHLNPQAHRVIAHHPRVAYRNDAVNACAVALLDRVQLSSATPAEAVVEAEAWLTDLTKQYAKVMKGTDKEFIKTAAKWYQGGGHFADPSEWNPKGARANNRVEASSQIASAQVTEQQTLRGDLDRERKEQAEMLAGITKEQYAEYVKALRAEDQSGHSHLKDNGNTMRALVIKRIKEAR